MTKLDSADTYPPQTGRYVKLLRDMLQELHGRPIILDSRFDHAVWFVAAYELHAQGRQVKIEGVKAIGSFNNKGEVDARVVIAVSWHIDADSARLRNEEPRITPPHPRLDEVREKEWQNAPTESIADTRSAFYYGWTRALELRNEQAAASAF